MPIYTKTGDRGETGLFGGERVAKSHPRIDAYGTLDELNAALGMVRAESARAPWNAGPFGASLDRTLHDAQNRLFDLGSELAAPGALNDPALLIGELEIERLESAIDAHEETLPPLRQFILPGGAPTGASLHLARCVCRRAERRLVALAETDLVRESLIQYLNRLGDLLFVLARAANHQSGRPDTPWEKPDA